MNKIKLERTLFHNVVLLKKTRQIIYASTCTSAGPFLVLVSFVPAPAHLESKVRLISFLLESANQRNFSNRVKSHTGWLQPEQPHLPGSQCNSHLLIPASWWTEKRQGTIYYTLYIFIYFFGWGGTFKTIISLLKAQLCFPGWVNHPKANPTKLIYFIKAYFFIIYVIRLCHSISAI